MNDQERFCGRTRYGRPSTVSRCFGDDCGATKVGSKEESRRDIFSQHVLRAGCNMIGRSLITLTILISILFTPASTQDFQGLDFNALQQFLLYNPSLVMDLSQYSQGPPSLESFLGSQPPYTPQSSPPPDALQPQIAASILEALQSILGTQQQLDIPQSTRAPNTEVQEVVNSAITVSEAPINTTQSTDLAASVASNLGSISLENLKKAIAAIEELRNQSSLEQAIEEPTQPTGPENTSLESTKIERKHEEEFESIKAQLALLKKEMELLLQNTPPTVPTTESSSVEAIHSPTSVTDLNTKEGCKLMFPNQPLCDLLASTSATSTSKAEAPLETQHVPPSYQAPPIQPPVPPVVEQRPHQPTVVEQHPAQSITEIPHIEAPTNQTKHLELKKPNNQQHGNASKHQAHPVRKPIKLRPLHAPPSNRRRLASSPDDW